MSSSYASGQSRKVKRPQPREASEYEPKDTSNHQGIYSRCCMYESTGTFHLTRYVRRRTTGNSCWAVSSSSSGTGMIEKNASR